MDKKQAFFILLLTAVLGSSVIIVTKIGLKEIPPLHFLFWRLFFTTLLLLPLLKFKKHHLPLNLNNKIWLISLLPTANFLFYIFGINLTGATMSQTIYTFVPIMTAIVAHFLIKERLNVKKSAGILLGLAGTLIVVASPILNGRHGGDFVGNLLILLGSISWAAYPVIAKKFQANYTPLVLTTTMMIPATIISGLVVVKDYFTGNFITPSPLTWAFMGYSAVITVIYYLLIHRLIQKVSSVMGTIVLYIQPVTAFLWAAPLLGEKLTPGLILGGTLTIFGAYLVTKSSKD